jgi:hypothetical protein
MSTESLPQDYLHEPEYEKANVVSFEDYRRLCDSTDSFRRLGVLDEGQYYDGLKDPRTVYCRYGDNLVPLLMPLEYEDGYDKNRTRQLTQKNQPFLMVTPSELLSGKELMFNEGTGVLVSDMAVVVEIPAAKTTDIDDYANNAVRLLAPFGNFVSKDFLDPRIDDPDGQASSMSIFSFSFAPSEAISTTYSDQVSFDEAYERINSESRLPEKPETNSNATYLYNSGDLRNNPELVDKLWEISQKGFGEVLGQYHPVSMEESRDFFEEQIFGKNSFTGVRFSNGEPACFGTLCLDIENCNWLNSKSTVLQDFFNLAAKEKELTGIFSEIISNGQRGALLSPDVVAIFLKLSARTGRKCRALFESTNLSEMYIPMILDRSMRHCRDIVQSGPTKPLNKLYYKFLVKNNPVKPE